MPRPSDDGIEQANSVSYPRQYARTRRFTCGEPRNLTITPLGIIFLRSRGGADPVNCLWRVSVDRAAPHVVGDEQLLFDPAVLNAPGELPLAERARRERMREQASGITAYSVSADGRFATFALGGEIVFADISSSTDVATFRTLETPTGSFDPQLAPNAEFVSYLHDGALRAQHLAGADLVLAQDDRPDITWGLADFNAAEEFNRFRGYWWSPDGHRLAVTKVDNTPVQTWWIADPAHPDRPPTSHRYPVAGSANADVTLWLVATDGAKIEVQLRAAHPDFEYVLDVSWTDAGLLVTTLDRQQTDLRVLVVDDAGACTMRHRVSDDIWVELVPGTPALSHAGLVHTADDASGPNGHRSLVLVSDDGSVRLLTDPALLVEHVSHVSESASVVCTVVTDSGPMYRAVVAVSDSGSHMVAGGPNDLGVHSVAAADADLVVVRSASLERLRAEHRIFVANNQVGAITSLAETPAIDPQPVFIRAGLRQLPTAVLLPTDPALRNGVKLPVVMDPYAGPHAARVLSSRAAMASSQWLADQGFAVVVVDGRGTPGIGPTFERSIHHDLAGPVLADQVAGLLEAGAHFPELDLSRVGIRGWSFGGYTAALAVLKRPDVFHCAVVGAPVIDWRLYDTGYTERYLGNPSVDDEPYEASSLLSLASTLTRPLQLIHGLADDNVVAAHTLRFSSALVAAGIAHEVLPLSGVTHMTSQEEVAENMLLLQVDFLRRHLGGPTRV